MSQYFKTEVAEYNNTSGTYRTKGFKFTALAGQTTTYDISFSYDIEILAGKFYIDNANIGDMAELIVYPGVLDKKMIESLYIIPKFPIEIGMSKIGSSYIPANTPLRITYNNIGTTDVEVIFSIDLLY